MNKYINILFFIILNILSFSSNSLAETGTVVALPTGCFIENKGQWGDSVLFGAKASNMNIWIYENSIQFDILKKKVNNFEANSIIPKTIKLTDSFEINSVRMNFISSLKPDIVREEKTETYFNYFYGKSKITGVPAYRKLKLSNIYNGVSIVLGMEQNKLRYDFELKPQANPDNIRFQISGADAAYITPDKISFKTHLTEIIHSELFAYQTIDSKQVKIESSFSLDENGTVMFRIDDYDRSEKLTIDPIIFSTYIGGDGYDHSRAIAIDDLGNPVITGYTSSYNFPATKGVFEPIPRTLGGLSDIFVSKFDSLGKNLIFSTFIGGELDDYAEDIVVDAFGYIYLAGYTNKSGTFPTSDSAYQKYPSGGFDAVAIKMLPNGTDLIYSTLLGGDGDDYAQSLAIDQSGSAYITGYTSGTFNVSQRAFQKLPAGGNEGFIIKLNRFGTDIIYATYLGGTDDDFAQNIIVNENGAAHVTGLTRSKNFPVSENTFSDTLSDALELNSTGDAFVTVFTPDGRNITYSTYLGGSESDGGYGITMDVFGSIYITGYTESHNFPTTENAFSRKYHNSDSSGGRQDVFVTKISSSGMTLDYSTYIGGYNSEIGKSIFVDDIYCAHITGTSFSYNFPTTRNGDFRFINREDTLRTMETSSSDAFLIKLAPDGSSLWYSSFFGGSGSDNGNDMVLSYDGSVYLTGTTFSDNIQLSDSAYSKSFTSPGKSEAFVARFELRLGIDFISNYLDICYGDSVLIGGLANGGWGDISYSWSPIADLLTPDSAFTIAKPVISSTYTLLATDEKGNYGIADIEIIVHQIPQPEIFGPDSAIVGQTIEYSSFFQPENQIQWNVFGGELQSPTDSAVAIVKWIDSTSGSLVLTETSPWGCTGTAQIEKVVISLPHKTILHAGDSLFIFEGAIQICEGDSLIVDAGDGFTAYLWSNMDTTRTTVIKDPGFYWVLVTDSLGTGYSDTLAVDVHTVPSPKVYGPLVVPIGSQAGYMTDYYSGSSYSWSCIGGEVISGADSTHCVIVWKDSTSPSILLYERTIYGCTGLTEIKNIKTGKNFKPSIVAFGATSICNGDSVILDAGYGFSAYQWSDGTKKRFNTIKKSGYYWVAVRDLLGFAGMSDTVAVTVLAKPPKPRIRKSGDGLVCFDNSPNYQWYYYNDPIINATEKNYQPTVEGAYSVEVKGANGCKNRSDTLHWKIVDSVVPIDDLGIKLYPNPNDGSFTVDLTQVESDRLELEIINPLGITVFRESMNVDNVTTLHSINTIDLKSGMYVLLIKSDGFIHTEKLIISR